MAKGIKRDEFITMLLRTNHYNIEDIELGIYTTGHIKRKPKQHPKKKKSFWSLLFGRSN
jgi:hypothetical protein